MARSPVRLSEAGIRHVSWIRLSASPYPDDDLDLGEAQVPYIVAIDSAYFEDWFSYELSIGVRASIWSFC